MYFREREKVFIDKCTSYIKRMYEDLESNDIWVADNHTLWSGKVIVGNKAFKKDTLARKEWSCNISVVNFVDDGIILHEMLHSCSSSYYDETTVENN